jgi:hypothetical protein
MAAYLRDRYIKNRSFTVEAVTHIFDVFEARSRALKLVLDADPANTEECFFSVVIRFDNRGNRTWTRTEFLQYFNQAEKVERLSFEIDTSLSLKTNKQSGAYCTLQLDVQDTNRCWLQVTCDDREWVETTYTDVMALVDKYRSFSGIVRTSATQWIVQVVGVSLGVLVCLALAKFVAPTLSVENPFLIAFLFCLLMFSNSWTHLYPLVMKAINKAFPNVMFVRPSEERLHWILQGLVGVALAAAVSKVGVVAYGVAEKVIANLFK